jgi:hypothetical protein
MKDLSSAERDQLLESLKQISEAYTAQEQQRDIIKDIVDQLADAIDADKKVIRKLARLHHKQRVHDFETEAANVSELYAKVLAVKK